MPPLDKKGDDNKTSESVLKKHMQALQHFFTELQRYKVLRSSSTLEKFLSTAGKTEFGAEKKAIGKLPPVKSLSDVKLPEGKFNCGLNKNKNKMAKQIDAYVPGAIALYQDLILNTEDTCTVMHVLSDAMAKNASIFRKLAILHAGIEVTLEGVNNSAQNWLIRSMLSI